MTPVLTQFFSPEFLCNILRGAVTVTCNTPAVCCVLRPYFVTQPLHSYSVWALFFLGG